MAEIAKQTQFAGGGKARIERQLRGWVKMTKRTHFPGG
jgi:hypothetical protein